MSDSDATERGHRRPLNAARIRRVLSIDDSEADQALNRIRIEAGSPAIELEIAYDVEKALEVLQASGSLPDIILLDISMPRMDGFDFLERFSNQFPEPGDCVVVMLTSSLNPADRERANQFDVVHGFLQKPLGVGLLRDIQALPAKG